MQYEMVSVWSLHSCVFMNGSKPCVLMHRVKQLIWLDPTPIACIVMGDVHSTALSLDFDVSCAETLSHFGLAKCMEASRR